LDEVDTGIGGKTARSVGKHIHKLADRRQVIAITHLAAVACHADHHHRIDKVVSGKKTSITIDTLTDKERVAEIARMLSGGADDTTARRHARELLKEAQAV
jgi:DNA repair protein RecN (Recombination protein N)